MPVSPRQPGRGKNVGGNPLGIHDCYPPKPPTPGRRRYPSSSALAAYGVGGGGVLACDRRPSTNGRGERARRMKHFLLASDFDQTLSFNDSGLVLSEMLGIGGFAEKTAGLSEIHLVQQGAELAYLLLHDPEFRRVRREDLIEVGRRIRLKPNLEL